MMTFILIILCRKYDSTQDTEIYNKEYTNNEKVKKVFFVSIKSLFVRFVSKFFFIKKFDYSDVEFNISEDTNQSLNNEDLHEFRRIRLLDIKLWSILKEASIFLIFLLLIYAVSFFNLNNSAFTYNQLFLSTFVEQKSSIEIGLKDVILDLILKNVQLR